MDKTHDTLRKGTGIALGAGLIGSFLFPPVGMAAAVAVSLSGVGLVGVGAAARAVNAYEQWSLQSPQTMQQVVLLRDVEAFLGALAPLTALGPGAALTARTTLPGR